MREAIYTDAPAEVEKALARGQVLNISIDELVRKSSKERVTIMIDRENLDFFRGEAKTHGVPYQTMINNSLTATRYALQKQATA